MTSMLKYKKRSEHTASLLACKRAERKIMNRVYVHDIKSVKNMLRRSMKRVVLSKAKGTGVSNE